MRYTVIAKALLTIGLATASPIADRDQPITDVEYGRIADLGLSRRDSASLVKRVTDQPITSEEYARIADMGLSKRSNAIEARDSRSNCGQTITGDQVGGNGVWCPVDQYYTIVDEFCTSAASTDVHIGHETSDTYGVSLTNQKDSSAPGTAGNVVCEFLVLLRESAEVKRQLTWKQLQSITRRCLQHMSSITMIA